MKNLYCQCGGKVVSWLAMTTPVKERTFESDEKLKIPKPFILRRLHSLLGFWLVIYLFGHLLVNSQAALSFQDEGYGFVTSVNRIHSIPYLKAVELILLALPFLIHGVLGIKYALTSKLNSYKGDKTRPELAQYNRNRAFSWQRITSWLLIIGILGHVVQMRFLHHPAHYIKEGEKHFVVRVGKDKALAKVAENMDISLYDQQQINERRQQLVELEKELAAQKESESRDYLNLYEKVKNERDWLAAMEHKSLGKNEVMADAPSAGGAIFLTVRDTFKSPWMVILYSLFVVASSYHAFNGLWTFMIKWGVTLTRRSQRRMLSLTRFFMLLTTLFGLAAAWGTFWTFQFQT